MLVLSSTRPYQISTMVSHIVQVYGFQRLASIFVYTYYSEDVIFPFVWWLAIFYSYYAFVSLYGRRISCMFNTILIFVLLLCLTEHSRYTFFIYAFSLNRIVILLLLLLYYVFILVCPSTDNKNDIRPVIIFHYGIRLIA